MPSTRVVIVGAGQAGLAVSHHLTSASIDHVLIERGRTAERWRSQRWDSLRLLTPNWMSRLPGWSYQGKDPGGFMPAADVVRYLTDYAESFRAPVLHGTEVRMVRRFGGRYLVDTDAGYWTADAVVIASGFADQPAVPSMAGSLDPSIATLTPDRYRNPADLPAGGVLIVGASATGVQLADELAADGRQVLLAAGRHTRLPRRYRGRDIMWWLDRLGALDRPADRRRIRRHPEPSLQIVGSPPHPGRDARDVDLPALAARGVLISGRLAGIDRTRVEFANDLAVNAAAADASLTRLLHRIDDHVIATGLEFTVGPAAAPRPFTPNTAPATRVDLRSAGISSVVWATGYRRRYPWLRVPVLDSGGEIRHAAGLTAAPGLVVVGQRWQTRRSSTFLDGVRHDAALVVDHLMATVLAGTVRRAS